MDLGAGKFDPSSYVDDGQPQDSAERQLRSLIESLPGVAFRCELSAPWRLQFISESVSHLTGYPAADFTLRCLEWETLIAPEDRERVRSAVADAIRDHRRYTIQYRIHRRDGEIRWVQERGGAVYTGEQPLFLEGFIGDIHEQTTGLEKLRQSEERFQLASRATQDVFWDWGVCTDRISWNAAVRDSLGYSLQDLETDFAWWLDRVHPEDRTRVHEELAASMTQRDGRFISEYRFLKQDGRYADILDRGYAIEDDAGNVVRMVGAMLDNSERIASHRALREREARLSTIFGQAMVGILHRSLSGKLLMVNERYCELLGRSEDEIRVLDPITYTHPDDAAWNRPEQYENIAAGAPLQIEKRYLRPDGEIVWCEVYVSYVHPGEGQEPSVLVVAQDITARKRAEDALAKQTELLQTIIDSVSDLIFVKDVEGRFVLANRALIDGCGNLVGRKTEDFFAEHLVPTYENIDSEVIARKEARSVEEVIPIKGEQRLFQTVKVPWHRGNTISGVIGVSRDITERKAAEEALRESEILYRSVLEASADCIVVHSLGGDIEFMNTPGREALDIDEGMDLAGKPWVELWPRQERRQVDAALSAAARGRTRRFSGFCPTGKGCPRWWDVLVCPMRDDNGSVVRILSISRDITSQRDTAERLRWASEHDALTGLPNRRAFEAHLRAATIRAMEAGTEVGLLLLDLDHFKHVNDTLGHVAGDHLLTAVSERLKATLRAGDFVGRLGGDEFAIILEGGAGTVDPLAVGRGISETLMRGIQFEQRHVSAGASIGGAIFPRDAENAHELFKNADIALYALKEGGRGGTRMFHDDMREHAQQVASQLSLARASISDQTVEPHYQPKVDLQTGAVVGFEALLRWRSGSSGLQLPDTVSEAFKDYELATKIGDVMQRSVFRDVRLWLNERLPIGFVAINAAPAEFLRDDFAERLIGRLREHDIPPSLIEVEVTEHVFLDRGSDFVGRALQLLDAAGVRIALDDFGTGHSSLSHLRDFPVDVVKIDRSFVEKMVSDHEVRAIVAAVIDLAKSLKIDVVAEGIESNSQQQLLLALGCRLGQGYYFGRPVQRSRVPGIVRNNGYREVA